MTAASLRCHRAAGLSRLGDESRYRILTVTRTTRGEEFEQLRPLLFVIAYRILGSVAESEDAVQKTWRRYEASPTQPRSTPAPRDRDDEPTAA